MHTNRPSPTFVLILACALAVVCFLLELAGLGGQFGGRYLLPVAVAFLWGRRRDIYIVTALASVLVLAAYWFGPPSTLDHFLLSHLFILALLWAAAWLLTQRRELQEQLARRDQELGAAVAARTAELAASEQRYRLLAESTTEVVWTVDLQGRLTYASPSLVQLLGYTREDFTPHFAAGELPPLLAAPVRQALDAAEAAEAEGRPFAGLRFVIPQLHKDGTRRLWTELFFDLLRDDAGTLIGLRATTRDITQRHLAEEALHRSQEQLAKIFRANPGGIAISSLADGTCLDANDAFLAMVGCTRDELIGHTLVDLGIMSTATRDQVRANFQEHGFLRGVDLQIANTRGEPVDVLYSLDQIDFDGAPALLGLVIDVTTQKRTAAALAASEAQLAAAYGEVRLAASAAHLGIWTWTFAGDRLDWDDRMCELYTMPVAQRGAGLTYAFWRSRVHPDDLAPNEITLAAARRDLAEWSSTFRIILPGSEVRYIYAASTVEQDAGGVPIRMVGVNRDVTDQVHYEQLLQQTNAELEQHVAARTADLQEALTDLQVANGLKDEFMAMISHELRTPLSGVLTLAEMLEEQLGGPLTPRQATYVQGIRRSGDHLLELINGILDYIHLISGNVQLHPTPCHLATLLDTCADPFRARADARRQTLAISVVPPDLTVYTDPNALAEVLRRLLDNAARFTPDGGRIGIDASLETGVGIAVWDTGIGIAPDQIDRILKPFTQGDGRLSRSHEGIGMGLAYVSQVVRLLGGTLQVASTPGRGSRFTITLPAPPRPLVAVAAMQFGDPPNGGS